MILLSPVLLAPGVALTAHAGVRVPQQSGALAKGRAPQIVRAPGAQEGANRGSPGHETLQRLMRVAARFRDDPEVGQLASRLATSRSIDVATPFRFHAAARESEDTLSFTVLSLASPRNRIGPRWLSWFALGKNRGDGPDPTLGKAIATLIAAAERRQKAHPALRHLKILAPSVANAELGDMLERLGFQPASHGWLTSLRNGQVVIGKSEFLELALDFAP